MSLPAPEVPHRIESADRKGLRDPGTLRAPGHPPGPRSGRSGRIAQGAQATGRESLS